MTSRTSGFTLLEILVVLVILGLALGIVANRGPARSPALDARGAAGQVARAMRLARSQAIAGNRPVAFTLDVARRAFRVGAGPWQALPPELGLGLVATADTAPGTIVFDPEGGASGGRVRISTGQAALSVGVDWLSGRVMVGDGG